MEQTADSLEISSRCQVIAFRGNSMIIERLKEIGIHQGVELEACGHAPFGGPRLYRLGATVIALRKEEALCLIIQKL